MPTTSLLSWATACICLTAATGCRTAPYVNSHLESVNAEYRQLEDYVYSLEDENARLQRELDDCKVSRRSAAEGDAGPASERGGLFRRKLRGTPSNESPELSPPTIEPGTPSGPAAPADTPPRRSTLNKPDADSTDGEDLTPPTVELPAPSRTEPKPAAPTVPSAPSRPESLPPARPTDTKVTHLFLNPVLTGGADLDSRPGDDGLSVVIEPRNAADEYVPQAGAISIVVLDPSKAGEAARVARWNFDPAATEQKLTASSAARGIRLQMPWPASAPATDRLHLFVRFEAADGRQIQTDREIFLTPPGQLSDRWTPRPADRQRPAISEPSPHVAQQPQPAAQGAGPNLLAPPTWSPYR